MPKKYPDLEHMNAIMNAPNVIGAGHGILCESDHFARISMSLLIKAANHDRRLLEDRDWQQAMQYLNGFVAKLHGLAALEGKRRSE